MHALSSGVEPSGACGPELVQLLKDAAESRSNKLTSSEYDETTWSLVGAHVAHL